jgi:hypothetical protein
MSEALVGHLATVRKSPHSAYGIGRCTQFKNGKYKIEWKILNKSDWFERKDLYFP